MKNVLIDKFPTLNSIIELNNEIKNKPILRISKLAGSLKALLVATILEKEKKLVLLLEDRIAVDELKVELSILGLEKRILIIDDFSNEGLQEKITTLNQKKSFILITTYRILKSQLPKKNSLEKNTTVVSLDSDLDYDGLIEYLDMLNYSRDKFVGNPGEFSVRGSIIDFWSFSEKHPCRVEFDGDILESLRYFDYESQRSSNKTDIVTIAPKIISHDETEVTDIFEYLDEALIIASQFNLDSLFTTKKKEVEETVEETDIDDELKQDIFENDITSEEVETVELEEDKLSFTLNDLYSKNVKWIIEQEIGNEERYNIPIAEVPTINSNFDLLFNLLSEYAKKDFQIIIATENEFQSKRLLDLLFDFQNEITGFIERGIIKIIELPIKSGFILKEDKLLLLTDYQLFNKPYRTKVTTKSGYKKSRVKDFASIKRGDYVVHEKFGIGKYIGLETIKIGLIEQESIKLIYANNDIVYVNLNYLSLIKRFSSNEDAQPRLSTLGSNEWKNTKKKVKTKIIEAARELIILYAQRKATPGFQFSPDTIFQKELEASFFYEDTPDQSSVSEQVKLDMESENPMDRLVCGDVGFGKTEIAIRAAFKAVNDSKQVGILVPTTILAEQHFNTFKDRLNQFPVKVAVLSRFVKQSVQKEIILQLAKGEIDIVIGTHRLLSKDVRFKDLGLLIIDEEQRFGVMAKEKLRSLRANVDTLTLTATPIPRTLNLSLLGARDLSIISTPPLNRQPIYTSVQKFDIVKVREYVRKEVARGGQIYFIHDRVQSIDKIAAYVQHHIPELKIVIAHGQMKPAQLEKVIYDFMNNEYHMLIATKIIESGIDIPNVNTIIINRADRFGLAELHQLRGRVGRSNRQAFAYPLVPSMKTISKKAIRRLQAIEEYTDLGGGFNLSMRDLEIRGAGNLLGTEQSGTIDTIGFDMYVKLLDEAVNELKQGEFKDEFKDLPKSLERSEPTIDTYFELGIPKPYMPDQSDRLSYYTAMFSIVKIDEIDEIKEDLIDRFGKIPLIIERLVLAATLRYYASITLMERIVILRDKISIILPKADREEFYQNKFHDFMQLIVAKYSRQIHFTQSDKVMKIEMKNTFRSPEETLNHVIDLIKEINFKVFRK
ncbi:MAG: transcription-repair coupling factor [Bacteroidetes bacterium]|nr:transcription-repair coupling factor [Bacteroidota bacterium]MBU1113907.1 transcription-repair coupling factor [Bacteroidota bacterium]MBU1798226.1 transcription-repair coupling factor [Bacteroidota bacterium]